MVFFLNGCRSWSTRWRWRAVRQQVCGGKIVYRTTRIVVTLKKNFLQSTMSEFSQLLAFACAARHQSFADAGRKLGVAPSTIAKRIVRLEVQLGVKLFHRTTRRVSLTSDGEVLYMRCERILADIDELEAAVTGGDGGPRGELRISVPIAYGKRVILPIVADLLHRYPEMSADVRLSDQFCDLIKDGMDAVVRVMPLADSRLVSRQFDEQRLLAVASRDYLARYGQPTDPSALGSHSFVLFRNPTSGRERALVFQAQGAQLDVNPSKRVVLDDGEGMVQAARLGIGIAQVPEVMVDEDIARGALVEVLADFRPPPLPISVVWPGNRLMPARVRKFVEALCTRGRTPED